MAEEKKNSTELVPLDGHQPSPDDSATTLRLPQAPNTDLSKAFGVEAFEQNKKK